MIEGRRFKVECVGQQMTYLIVSGAGYQMFLSAHSHWFPYHTTLHGLLHVFYSVLVWLLVVSKDTASRWPLWTNGLSFFRPETNLHPPNMSVRLLLSLKKVIAQCFGAVSGTAVDLHSDH